MKIILNAFFAISILTQVLFSQEIINKRVQNIYDSKDQKSKVDSELIRDSWINPLYIELDYSKSKDIYTSKDIDIKRATINLEQDIFRSGGIYSTIQKAGFLEQLNSTYIAKEKKETLSIVYTNTIILKRIDVEIKKLFFDIASKELTIKKKQQLYEHGLTDISELDESIIELSFLKNLLFDLKSDKLRLIREFKYISDMSYKSVDLSFLTLFNLEEFLNSSSELKVKKLNKSVVKADKDIVLSSYLPKLSVFGSYGYNDISLTTDTDYYHYGVKLTIPLDYNTGKNIETSKLQEHIASLELKQTQEYENDFYSYAINKIKNIDGKIKNTNDTIDRYENLYVIVQALYKGALRTIDDVKIMQNRLESSRLDLEILELDKKSVLNEIYSRIN